jgi:hypothetical protein
MNDEVRRLKHKAAQYFADMYVEYVVMRDGQQTTMHTRILNPEIGAATTGGELINALVTALERCPMTTMQSLEIRRMLADVRRCVATQP